MQKIVITVFLVLYCLAGNAQLKKFTVEVPQPPKFKISDSIQSFTIMDRSMTSEFENFNKDSLQLSFYRKNFETNYILLDSTVADTTIKVLGDILFNSNRFDIVIPEERNIPRSESYIKTPDPLNWAYVKNICDTYNTDALIVLENLALRVVTNYQTGREYANYSNYKTYYASMDYYYRAHWRIYDPRNKNIVVDFIMNQDTIYWDNFSYDLVELFEGLPSVIEAAYQTGIKTALDFSDIIAPIWTPATRYYYVLKNAAIDKSVKLAAEGNWQEALDNWLSYSESGGSMNRSKIMLNVALGYEMTGNLQAAIEWTKKSLDLYYREVTNHYLKELLKRELEQKTQPSRK